MVNSDKILLSIFFSVDLLMSIYMEYIVFYVAMQYEFITIACILSPGEINH